MKQPNRGGSWKKSFLPQLLASLLFYTAAIDETQAQSQNTVPSVTKEAEFTPAQLHRAPIILKAIEVNVLSGYSLTSYRLISNFKGNAVVIPFQIDEVGAFEDFVLPSGPTPNHQMSNGVFDNLDELSFMAEDVGASEVPSKWSFEKPDFLYRIDAKYRGKTYGSVFVGVYPNKSKRPQLSEKKYVTFNLKNSMITTSRYRYAFDPSNYLVVKGIEVLKEGGESKKIVNSSSFFLRADMKYFLTIDVGHSDITSKLEAYKSGPIRTIVRVTFSYSFMRLEFEMGMYTEVSFFSNSVVLPTIMYNPLEGSKALNDESGFYYGFATNFDTSAITFSTNMERFPASEGFSLFKEKKKSLNRYTFKAEHPDFLMLMEISPSWRMINNGNRPLLYSEPGDPTSISSRPWNKPLELGKAPVNLGVYFDLSNLSEGEHRMKFNLFFENVNSEENRTRYRNISRWYYTSQLTRLEPQKDQKQR